MNIYEVVVTGGDMLGGSFLSNIVELANKGAVLKEGEVPRMSFPHAARMSLETEEEMVSDHRYLVFPISEPKKEAAAKAIKEKEEAKALEEQKKLEAIANDKTAAKEHLESLSWEDFKAEVNAKGVSGRDRKLMQRQYLELI